MDAYADLLELIRTGEMPHDIAMSESSLAERLGMSRTPVREALRVLDAQGLVVSRGRGVRVRVPGTRELEEAFETRAALEGYAAESAAVSQGAGLLLPARMSEVERLASQCAQVTRTRGPGAGAEANRLFHLTLAALAGNSQIDGLLEVVWEQIAISTRAGLTVGMRIETVQHEHEEILNAIRLGRAKEARDAVTHHVSQTRCAIQQDEIVTEEHT